MTQAWCPRCGEGHGVRPAVYGVTEKGNPVDTFPRCRGCGRPFGNDPAEAKQGTFPGGR